MRRSKPDDAAGMALVAIIAIAVVVALVAVMVAWPYFTRAETYANDPTDPPEGVEDENPPDWMGKFEIRVSVVWGNVKDEVNDVKIEDLDTTLEDYEGQPWSPASLSPGWFTWSKPNSVKVEYTLSLTKGRTTVEDTGAFRVYKSADYTGTGRTDWFFWWEELEGNWVYDLKLTCEGVTSTQSGTFGYADGVGVVN